MARGLAVATSEPVQIWDGGPWDMEEGEDFEPGDWRVLACELKAIAEMLGGSGHASEIIKRDKKNNIISTTYRWQYLHRGRGWKGGL